MSQQRERSRLDPGEDLRLLIENVRDYAIFMLDPEGHITTWNLGAERLKGYQASEIIGKHFSIFYSAEDVANKKPDRELLTARAEGRVEDEGWRIRKDGSRFWANVVITAVYDHSGTLRGFGKVTRDLTERKRAEDDRVRLAEAEEAVRLRNEFLSIASHELRSPINTLNLHLQTMKLAAENPAKKDELTRHALDRALKQVRRLVELVEHLLDASRLAHGTLSVKFEPVDVRAVVSTVAENLRADGERAGSSMTLSLPEHPVEGVLDPLRIEQLVTNVVQNAIKYGRGGPIRIHLRRESDSAVIEVADRGIGVAKQDAERIFERFERGGNDDRFGGLGLGLYISRSIVDAHGGSISVDGETGVGSTFTIRLPLDRPNEVGTSWPA